MLTPLNRPSPARIALGEIWAPASILLLGIALLGRLLNGPWLPYFLYDGDSLALPLLLESLSAGEPFQWVMTSQLFVFPEAPLYLLSSLLAGGSPQASLLVNAVINTGLFYVLLRWITRGLLHGRTQGWQVGAAFLGTVTLLLLIALEGRGLNNEGAIAATFLLTTYYYGVIISSLLCIALIVWVTRGLRSPIALRSWRTWVFVVLTVIVSALTTLSNPLFLMQFVAPLLVAAVLVWLLNGWRLLTAGVCTGALLVGVVIGSALRARLAAYIALDAGTYLHLERAAEAVDALGAQALDVLSTPPGQLELGLIAALLVMALAGFCLTVYTRSRRSGDRVDDNGTLFLLAFVSLSAVSILVGQVVSGSMVSRYLLPLATFSVFVVVVIIGSRPAAAVVARTLGALRLVSGTRLGAALAILIVVGSGIVGLRGLPKVAEAATTVSQSTDESCLVSWIDGRDLDGVGSFWSTRPLTLYGDDTIDVQQINFDFTAQLWMNNFYSYEGKSYSYLLADYSHDWAALALKTLGEPRSITNCETFDIYDYSGTSGEVILNEIITTGIRHEKSLRSL